MKTVFFDLDDTLFDHRRSARAGLVALADRYSLRARSIDEIETEYHRLLAELHPRVMAGDLSPDESRRTRYQRLFQFCGTPIDDTQIGEALRVALAAYSDSRSTVEGARELLKDLKADHRIAIISNNFLSEQQEKLRIIGIADYIDELIVSEEVGVMKPDRLIFEVALQRMEARPGDSVMVGDAWESDVVGATQAGIRAIWFNRFGLPVPQPGIATELRSFVPLELVRNAIGRFE